MNELKPFQMGPNDNSWKTSTFRQNVVAKIEEAIQQSGMQVARNSNEMENHVFMKAKTKDEYMSMVAKLILHVREMCQQKASQVAPNMQGPTQNQMAANQQVQNQAAQAQQGPGSSQTGLAPDPINALQNLASQGSRNQMMNMGGPQGQMQQQNVLGQNPGMPGMQAQMGQQGPIVSQSGPQGTQTASNLLQTLTQRPQLNMQMQGKLGPMGMVPNQNQMGNNMVAGMGGMGNPMAGQLQNQLGGPGMQGQMMPNMSMQNSMPMSVANSMVGQMQCNQVVGGMTGQLPTTMQSQMPGQMVGMTGNQMGINMLQHIQNRTQGKPDVSGMLTAGYGARGPQPSNFFRQSPSPSAPSPNMGGPSPVSMGVMGNAMSSPMSLSNLGCAGGVGVGSPAHAASPSAPHLTHHPQQMAPQQRGVGMSMVASPSSSLNTPVGAGGGGGGGAGTGGASPGGEEAAYREKVRQLSKYIEPLRRMVHRMVSEGENVEKLTKMKNLLDILSNPNKRMPLETLIKCEVVLEKLDFKRSESVGLGPQIPGSGKEQIFNPLLEVVNNCLQSPLANHTLKRTFASTLDALNGPEIKNLPPPHKVAKSEETASEIPDILQGEIARLDSRFKVSLETMQLCNGGEGGAGGGAISLIAQLDDARLPCVPPVHVSVPRDYPARAPAARLRPRGARAEPPDSFLARVEKAMEARCARLPKSCSLGQLLDAWEMSVRQACTPHANYTPVPALGI